MGNILGLDIGDKYIGTSTAQEGSFLASPGQTIIRGGGKAEQKIIELVASHSIATIVVGVPFSDDGGVNDQCKRVRQFCRRLSRRLPTSVKLIEVDEYMTSEEAQGKLVERRFRGKIKRTLSEDSVAATLILQSYLDEMTK